MNTEQIENFLFSYDKYQDLNQITVRKVDCVLHQGQLVDTLDVTNVSMEPQPFNELVAQLKQRNLRHRILRVNSDVVLNDHHHYEVTRGNKTMIEQRAGWH